MWAFYNSKCLQDNTEVLEDLLCLLKQSCRIKQLNCVTSVGLVFRLWRNLETATLLQTHASSMDPRCAFATIWPVFS